MRSGIASIVTTRIIGSIASNHFVPNPGIKSSKECKTNADTFCLGKIFVILEYTRRSAEVYAYDKSLKTTEGMPIVSGVTAWDDPMMNQTYILVINEAIYYGTKLYHSLINPNQVWNYVNNFWENPYNKERGLGIELDDSIDVILRTKGTTVLFDTRSRSDAELRDCPQLQITVRNEWNPGMVSLNEMKTGINDNRPSMRISELKVSSNIHDYKYLDSTDDVSLLNLIEPSLSNLKEQLLEKVPRNVIEVTR